MKIKLLAFSLMILGFTYYFQSYEPMELASTYTFSPDDLKSFDTGSLFFDIFLNNLILGILLSIAGYFTGGIITSALLFWNGYILGSVFKTSSLILTASEILFYSKHIFTELLAFILFSEFGYKGFNFYKKIILNKHIEVFTFGEFKSLVSPVLLLILSAYIEIL